MTHSPTDEHARWQAVLSRDRAAEGTFVYAVTTTGVYCRPTCPSRRPRRENVAFFDSPAAARAAGFRSCLRCRPGEVSSEQQVVARVRTLLESTDPAPTLADLARETGLSAFHLQRLFKRATGLSPKQYAAAWRVSRLKAGLKAGASVTQAMYDAGYGSTHALYADAPRRLGMSPGAYRAGGAGVSIRYAAAETPFGPVVVAATEKGVCAVRFGDVDAVRQELAAEFPRAALAEDAAALAPYTGALVAHLAGERRDPAVPLDLEATPFQRRVWDALQAIPYGQTRSYSEVARMIGEPAAVRAVARACATNPVALLIPCHRVLRAGGELSGYRWGVDRKQALLTNEQVHADR